MVYYGENDPKLAPWLYELMASGHIAPGYVDTRSIEDVTPDDLREFKQHHFFAGIGGWSYALRLAGWPDDRPVHTGSCPCQPFSAAGKGAGFGDQRHLWPAWHWLISQCRPGVIFGEQVASKDGLAWLDLVLSDLEVEGYAAGAFDIGAAGVGAPHIRQRLWIVADRHDDRLAPQPVGRFHDEEHHTNPRGDVGNTERSRLALGVRDGRVSCGPGGTDARQAAVRTGVHVGPVDGADGVAAVDAIRAGGGLHVGSSPWRDADWIACRDGKARPTQPGLFPLAARLPGRVVLLRGAGNAIVPAVAAQVIGAYLETRYP